MNKNLKAALEYIERGWSIIPIEPKGKIPCIKSWEPFKTRQATEEEVIKWFTDEPDANLAVLTGKISNLVVVDIDETVGEMYYENVKTTVSTTGRGKHLYFQYPANGEVKIDRSYPGIDIQGDDAYVLVPPSIHPNGKTYGWIGWDFIGELPVFRVPDEKLFPKIRDITTKDRNTKLNTMLWAWQIENKASFENLYKHAKYLSYKIKNLEGEYLVQDHPKTQVKKTTESVYEAWEKEKEQLEVESKYLYVTSFMNIKDEKLEWLWPGVIPKGKLSLIIGDPGHGKSLITIEMAACVSAGKPFPDGTKPEPGNVLMVFCEDGAGDTVKPRLRGAGADLTKVLHLTAKDRWLYLDKDLLPLKKIIEETTAELLIIDPITAYLGKVNSWKDDEVRTLLTSIGAVAEITKCAIVCIMHLNKKISANAIDRGVGSIAFSAVARSVFLVGPYPEENDTRKVMVSAKSNLTATQSAMIYRIQSSEENYPFIEWEGTSSLTAIDVLKAESKMTIPNELIVRGKHLLEREMKDGNYHKYSALKEKGEKEGLDTTILYAAANSLNVERKGSPGHMSWKLRTPVNVEVQSEDDPFSSLN